MNRFTSEDLLQYLYKETSVEKTVEIKTALETDWALREEFNQLAVSKEMLDSVKVPSPRQQVLDNILKYAEKSVEEHA
ncbi:MAG: hypothetical protein IPO46_07885 [Chitinophagaceae bacterium]|jgi:uncharacterized membrane protein|nr:hypothetical protein [Chitinophagaceae bacterium]MBP6370704.1 hypothetical protein [Ferruginibacter sp.]NMD29094.1 hypothetical protein [Bacteroidota bacterium]MBK7088738.1 hypothetical protein [Chitinophagaceae bacterium]MBK7348076.1 hypothetical protein [Chitinophagaceae bacterium]